MSRYTIKSVLVVFVCFFCSRSFVLVLLRGDVWALFSSSSSLSSEREVREREDGERETLARLY